MSERPVSAALYDRAKFRHAGWQHPDHSVHEATPLLCVARKGVLAHRR